MGVTVVIDSLEDMCALMCDNAIPENEIFNDDEKKRCRDCFYLVSGLNGEWICDNYSLDIHNVTNDMCCLEQD